MIYIKKSYVFLISILILITSACTTDNSSNEINLGQSTAIAPTEIRYVNTINPKYESPVSITYSINTDSPPILWKEMLIPREAESQALINDLSFPEQLNFYFESCEATHGKYTFVQKNTIDTSIPRTLLECDYDIFNGKYQLKVTYSYANSTGYYDSLNNEVISISRKNNLINIYVFSGLLIPSTADEAERYAYGLNICAYSTNKNETESRIRNIIREFRSEYEHSPNYYLHAYCDYPSGGFHCSAYIENYGVSHKYNAIIKVMKCLDTISDQINYIPVKIVN